MDLQKKIQLILMSFVELKVIKQKLLKLIIQKIIMDFNNDWNSN